MKDKTNFLWLSMLLLTAMLFTLPLKAQVTIGSLDVPRATLDVVAANPSSATAAEGVIAPRLTGDQIKAKDGAYGADQRGVIVYATDAVGAASTKTAAITAAGYYYFDGSVWKAFGSGGASGGTTVNVLRQNVSSTYSPAANVFTADRTVIIGFGATSVAMNLPDLTAGETGKEVVVHNATASGNLNVNYTKVDNTANNGTTIATNRTQPITNSFTASFLWCGTHWVIMAR